jgi:hypothetical protein
MTTFVSQSTLYTDNLNVEESPGSDLGVETDHDNTRFMGSLSPDRKTLGHLKKATTAFFHTIKFVQQIYLYFF